MGKGHDRNSESLQCPQRRRGAHQTWQGAQGTGAQPVAPSISRVCWGESGVGEQDQHPMWPRVVGSGRGCSFGENEFAFDFSHDEFEFIVQQSKEILLE